MNFDTWFLCKFWQNLWWSKRNSWSKGPQNSGFRFSGLKQKIYKLQNPK